MSAPIRVAVAGAAGRMGSTVVSAVEGAGDDVVLAGKADPTLGVALTDVLGDADVVVDFTRPDTALANALACVEAGVHCVMGTTGFDLAPLRAALLPWKLDATTARWPTLWIAPPKPWLRTRLAVCHTVLTASRPPVHSRLRVSRRCWSSSVSCWLRCRRDHSTHSATASATTNAASTPTAIVQPTRTPPSRRES